MYKILIIFFLLYFTYFFFAYMTNINIEICDYITKEWLLPWIKEGKSQNSFAIKHNIDESTVRKIKGKNEYRVPVETLSRICEAEFISLSEFFKKIGY